MYSIVQRSYIIRVNRRCQFKSNWIVCDENNCLEIFVQKKEYRFYIKYNKNINIIDNPININFFLSISYYCIVTICRNFIILFISFIFFINKIWIFRQYKT